MRPKEHGHHADEMPVIFRSRTRTTVLAAVCAALLSSCAGGRERSEIAVPRLPPLSVPPHAELMPPQEGEPHPSSNVLQHQTLDVLLGGPSPRSEIERQVLSHAGKAAPGIRSGIGDLQTHTVAKGRITQNLLAAPPGDGRVAQAFVPNEQP
jgi:hypothetical protein